MFISLIKYKQLDKTGSSRHVISDVKLLQNVDFRKVTFVVNILFIVINHILNLLPLFTWRNEDYAVQR